MGQKFRSLAVNLCLFGGISLLAACGGDEDSEPVLDTMMGPVVVTETGDGQVADQAADQGSTQDTTPDDNLQAPIPVLSIGDIIQGQVAQGDFLVYQVPSDTQVIVTSETGNADLFLYNSPELEDENFLCSDVSPFREDSCSASDTEVYALVFGREASSFSLTATADCSVGAINEWAYRNMQDYYIFADSLPVIDPSTYASANDLVRDIRLEPYSGVSNAAARNAFFEAGSVFSTGFVARFDENDDARLLWVDENSPLGRTAVARRGDISLGVNGVLWADVPDGFVAGLLGDEENPGTIEYNLIDGVTGQPKDVTVSPARYSIDSVLYVGYFVHPQLDGTIGYIVFNDFIAPAEDELNDAFQELIDNNVTELVLDLRYNPGGFTFIARRLAAQIAGSDLAGNPLVRYQHNNRYRNLDEQRFFEPATPELNLDRVVVLTTAETASSSELVINSLRPYIDVVVVGERTEGKGFISRSNEYCGVSLSAMHAVGVNANEVSVTGGIVPNCHATDDTSRDFGITRIGDNNVVEGMLLSGLDYIVFGTCEVAPETTTIAQRRLQLPNTNLPSALRPFTAIDSMPRSRP